MALFETILVLLIGATVLSAIARHIGIPYPTLLAFGGAMVALLPESPRLDIQPELIMCLFVAPVLMDAAYDISLRDLRKNHIPILSLVLGAVGLSTVAVAVVVRWLFPDFPWAAGLVLGALLAPPDSVAALAVLKQLNLPHRIRIILEGESLLNDASALLIYKLAVGAVVAHSFSLPAVLPAFAVVVLGGALLGWLATYPAGWLSQRFENAPVPLSSSLC